MLHSAARSRCTYFFDCGSGVRHRWDQFVRERTHSIALPLCPSVTLCQCLQVCRVSDAGHEQRRHVHVGRRPKAAKERTRGRWWAEGAAQLAMGIWPRRRPRGKERVALGRERYCGWEPAEAWVDGGSEPWRRLIEACVDGRAAQLAQPETVRLADRARPPKRAPHAACLGGVVIARKAR